MAINTPGTAQLCGTASLKNALKASQHNDSIPREEDVIKKIASEDLGDAEDKMTMLSGPSRAS